MDKNYNGKLERCEIKPYKSHFNVWGFLFWILSLFISLIPIYINMIGYYDQNGEINKMFLFLCFTEYDALWVFTTFLMFILFDAISMWIHNKLKVDRSTNKLIIFAIIVTILTEATWIALRCTNFKNPLVHIDWVNWLGCIEIVLTILLSAPIRIYLLKKENKIK